MVENEYDEVADLSRKRPHVVILGAGASKAAFPEVDGAGMRVPLMMDLVETVGLGPLLDDMNIKSDGLNFEEVFNNLYESNREADLANVEKHLEDYFSAMSLPPEPCLYDHLVLSLRAKDLIATFNWDPYLMDALHRNFDKGEMPRVVFLHGNVAIGICRKDKKVGPKGRRCVQCGRPYESISLMYPIKTKDYGSDAFIVDQWTLLRERLERAYILTIFGYSTPVVDVEAMGLLTDAWGLAANRNLEQVEIIDKPDLNEDEISRRWERFIHTHHYETFGSFYQCSIAQHPRRSCEAMWQRLMELRFLDENVFPIEAYWDELYKMIEPRISFEQGSEK